MKEKKRKKKKDQGFFDFLFNIKHKLSKAAQEG